MFQFEVISKPKNTKEMTKKVILQGMPGIGKTTLIKKIITKLREMGLDVKGFYTEEVRNSKNYRIGFDVVTLNNERSTLARKSNGNSTSRTKIGSYEVFIAEFEKLALSVFEDTADVLIIDEIGKMELLSKKFQVAVEKVILDPNQKVIATIPLKGGSSIIQNIKKVHSDNLITVTSENRESLLNEILSMINN